MGMAIQELRQLSVSERIQLVEDLWDTIAQDTSSIVLSTEHVAELDQRLDAMEKQPEAGISWDKARERILRSL